MKSLNYVHRQAKDLVRSIEALGGARSEERAGVSVSEPADAAADAG